jgi:hypothetical protein
MNTTNPKSANSKRQSGPELLHNPPMQRDRRRGYSLFRPNAAEARLRPLIGLTFGVSVTAMRLYYLDRGLLKEEIPLVLEAFRGKRRVHQVHISVRMTEPISSHISAEKRKGLERRLRAALTRAGLSSNREQQIVVLSSTDQT